MIIYVEVSENLKKYEYYLVIFTCFYAPRLSLRNKILYYIKNKCEKYIYKNYNENNLSNTALLLKFQHIIKYLT